MRVHRIALIGASSRIGPAILDALLASPPLTKREITILIRPASKPIPPRHGVRTIVVPSDPPTVSDLTDALSGIDALVCALNPSDFETQRRLADACVRAGVSRFVPADYGSARSDDPLVLDLLPNFRNKQLVREHCQRLAEEHLGTFTWTSLITGHFFDYGLRTELLGFDVKGKEVLLFDGGEAKWSTSTVKQIGKAVVAVLEREEETANRLLLVQSFCVTQLEVLWAIEAALPGREKLRRTIVDSKRYIAEKSKGAEEGDAEATEELVAVLGILRSNWTGDEAFANGLLGLEEEDLGKVVKEVVRDIR